MSRKLFSITFLVDLILKICYVYAIHHSILIYNEKNNLKTYEEKHS